MAAKKNQKKPQAAFGSKADFIRSQPESMSAREVVEAAAKQGLEVTVNHVYNLRTAAKARGGVETVKAGPPSSRRREAGGESERQLRSLMAEVGLARTREILESLERAFRDR